MSPSRGTGPIEHRLQLRSTEVAYFEWNPELRDEAPPVVFAHATGFHARVWDQTLNHLNPRWAIGLDQRGHGRSQKTKIKNWKVFGDDLAEFVERLDLRSIIGVGHSMGGHAMVEAAAFHADRFERLLLIDPVISAPDQYGPQSEALKKLAKEGHPTIRRRNHFESAQEMFERFRNRPPFSRFTPAALRDYCEHGLIPIRGGDGFQLACPPEVEASIYLTARSNPGVFESAARVTAPVTILRAKLPNPDRDIMDFSSSPTWPDLVTLFSDGLDVHWRDASHFIPMEKPDWTAQWVAQRDARNQPGAGP